MAPKNTKTVKVDSVRYKDKRTNIPTEELRDFVARDEAKPAVRLLVMGTNQNRETKAHGRRSTRPRAAPSDPPATGKIAIKVINHYGDEVLKVYDV
jgi:hypothetical protein